MESGKECHQFAQVCLKSSYTLTLDVIIYLLGKVGSLNQLHDKKGD